MNELFIQELFFLYFFNLINCCILTPDAEVHSWLINFLVIMNIYFQWWKKSVNEMNNEWIAK